MAIIAENHLDTTQRVIQKIRQSLPYLKTLTLHKNNICETTLQGHTASVLSVAILPNGNAISASADSTLTG